VQILIREKCDKCGGSGSITPYEKALFDEQWVGEDVPMNEIIKFRYEFGYDPTEPKKIECSKCGGEKYIKKWMDAEDVSTLLR